MSSREPMSTLEKHEASMYPRCPTDRRSIARDCNVGLQRTCDVHRREETTPDCAGSQLLVWLVIGLFDGQCMLIGRDGW